MSTVILNSKENEVYNACIAEAKASGDNGCELQFCELKVAGLSKNALKGYVSQLVQKGLVSKLEDCYFDLCVSVLVPSYLGYITFTGEVVVQD